MPEIITVTTLKKARSGHHHTPRYLPPVADVGQERTRIIAPKSRAFTRDRSLSLRWKALVLVHSRERAFAALWRTSAAASASVTRCQARRSWKSCRAASGITLAHCVISRAYCHVLQCQTPPLDNRLQKPHGDRDAGGISLSGCQPNRLQATIEYSLIAAGIAVAIITALKGIGTKLNTTFSSISTQLK